jgi:YbgC/YbaW family acyl-CoA thioester hydrolase
MPPVFRTTRTVEFGDTDMAGIVHFAMFFRYMEAAEHAFLRSRGLSVVLTWEGEKVSVPRVAASCDYLRPVRFGDELTITVEVQRIGRSSVCYGFEFFKGDDMVARGRVSAVFCRFEAEGELASWEIPAAIRSRLDPGAGSQQRCQDQRDDSEPS